MSEGVRRGTTPTLTLTISKIDISKLSNYEVYIKQDNKVMMVFKKDRIERLLDKNAFVLKMTQSETLQLKESRYKIQARMMYGDGTTVETDIVEKRAKESLSDEVMKNG